MALKNILGFDAGTGGRFSVWTGINIGFFLSHGRTAFEKFLSGANSIDILSSQKPELNPHFHWLYKISFSIIY